MKLFQSFRLDAVNQCLWRGEDRVSLAPKAFAVLRYLVEHPGRLVTQDELLEALWPETYVQPEVLRKYVLEIRKVLGDRPEHPQFIETLPKRGFQFVASVSDEDSASLPDLGAQPGTLVGRESALAQLDGCLSKALRGQRQVVFVTGEAGIGKTTLVDAFQRRAIRHSNLRAARGQCVEGFGGKEAYYPVLEAFGQLVRDTVVGVPLIKILASQAPTWLIQFSSLLKPEQKQALQQEILGATRERMLREICQALEAVTSESPLVLILEDVHWVDHSTLDFISAVARRRGPAKMLLLATYRPVEVILSHSPLKVLKQDLLIHRLCHEIALECLEESQVGEYLSAEFPDNIFPKGLTALVHRHSDGNPLFMAAIVGHMAEKGLILRDAGQWKLGQPLEDMEPGVPETLQQMLEVQLDQLSTQERRVLEYASVAGERFSVWALSAMLDINPSQIEGVCDQLADGQRFIRPVGIHELADGSVSAHYEFKHTDSLSLPVGDTAVHAASQPWGAAASPVFSRQAGASFGTCVAFRGGPRI